MKPETFKPDIIYVSPEVEAILKSNGFKIEINQGLFKLIDAKGSKQEYPLSAYSYFGIEKRGKGLSIVYDNKHGSHGEIPLGF
ncbi:MAG: hypothetical protein WC794_00125 [Candidatus Doudnabacteria bacterium]|jgi:hypothetical protein